MLASNASVSGFEFPAWTVNLVTLVPEIGPWGGGNSVCGIVVTIWMGTADYPKGVVEETEDSFLVQKLVGSENLDNAGCGVRGWTLIWQGKILQSDVEQIVCVHWSCQRSYLLGNVSRALCRLPDMRVFYTVQLNRLFVLEYRKLCRRLFFFFFFYLRLSYVHSCLLQKTLMRLDLLFSAKL